MLALTTTTMSLPHSLFAPQQSLFAPPFPFAPPMYSLFASARSLDDYGHRGLHNSWIDTPAALQWRRLRAIEKSRRLLPWQTDGDQAELALHMSSEALAEGASLSAQMSRDGSSLKIKSSKPGCACEDSLLAEISLPFGLSSADDVELVQSDSFLTIRVTKPAPPALDIKIIKATVQPERDTRDPQQEERDLDSKFKIDATDSPPNDAATEMVEKHGHVDGVDEVKEEPEAKAVQEPEAKAVHEQEAKAVHEPEAKAE